ncbi:hypothetical protein [Micromonospora sp. NPDC005173]|uniref:hypothetical protein n=1 Tax=Micromonospora sp. NPDC005173 TaxID=3157165 RepID=UPI0033AB3FB8
MRGKIDICPTPFAFWVVGQAQPEVAVDLQLVFGFGVSQRGDHVAEFFDDGDDLLFVEAADAVRNFGSRHRLLALFGALPFRLGFGDSSGDQPDGRTHSTIRRVATSAQRGLPAGLAGRRWSCCGGFCAGLGNNQIAWQLHISRSSAEFHLTRIFCSEGVERRRGHRPCPAVRPQARHRRIPR